MLKKLLLTSIALLALPALAHAQAANCRVSTSAPTYADGSTAPLSCETDGDLRTNATGGSGGTSETDDAAFTAGSDAGTPIMGFVTTDDVDSGDVGAVGMTDDRALHVNIRADDGTEVTSWPVTGTVDLGATDNGVLDAIDGNTNGIEALLGTIDADTSTLAGAVSGTEMQVDIVADGAGLALDTSVDGVETLLGTIDADTSNMATSLGTLDNIVSGSEAQVDVVGSLPAGTAYVGDVGLQAVVGGSSTDLVTCNSSVAINTASSGNTQLVALQSSQQVRVCGYNFIAGGDVDVQLIFGTGTACATGETDLTGPYDLTTNSGIVVQSPYWTGMASDASEALCIELSGAVQVSGVLFYTQY